MNEFFYTTIENQMRNDGGFGLLYDHFIGVDENTGLTAEQRALAKFHLVASYAVTSDIPYHSITLVRSDGAIIENRICDRRTNAPVQEEEPEE